VRIATARERLCIGGMDDFMKRTERERLLPVLPASPGYEATSSQLVGKNTGDLLRSRRRTYGLMILSDFWGMTQDYNIERRTSTCSPPTPKTWW
jgi:hypothetical protein